MAAKTKVLIMGAAGRDFHNFNTYFRDNEAYDVVAFTATQIPYINDRKYPAELAGKLYPDGIRIYDESEMPELVKKLGVEQVVFAYSDVPYDYVMHRSALVNALGADFRLLGPEHTMVKSTKPVIAVCAVRTGAGKSQTTRKIQTTLRAAGKKVVTIRHPMPYGDLVKQRVHALRHRRGPRQEQLHHRGDGRVRASRHGRQRDLLRRRLRGNSARGREGSRHHPLGRRQQRLRLLQARPLHHGRRPASSRRRPRVLPG